MYMLQIKASYSSHDQACQSDPTNGEPNRGEKVANKGKLTPATILCVWQSGNISGSPLNSTGNILSHTNGSKQENLTQQ